MRKFVIERTIPGAGNLSALELQAIAGTSCEVVNGLGKPYHWLQTFVTENKMYCVHIAESEEVIRLHAERAGFPVDTISEVKTIIDPTTSIK
jgi:hypothetical protein